MKYFGVSFQVYALEIYILFTISMILVLKKALIWIWIFNIDFNKIPNKIMLCFEKKKTQL